MEKPLKGVRARRKAPSLYEVMDSQRPEKTVILTLFAVWLMVFLCLVDSLEDPWFMLAVLAECALLLVLYDMVRRETKDAKKEHQEFFWEGSLLFRKRWRILLGVVFFCALLYLLLFFPARSFVPLIAGSAWCVYGFLKVPSHVSEELAKAVRLRMWTFSFVTLLWGLGSGLAVHFLEAWLAVLVCAGSIVAIAALLMIVTSILLYTEVVFGMIMFGAEGILISLLCIGLFTGDGLHLGWRWFLLGFFVLQLSLLAITERLIYEDW